MSAPKSARELYEPYEPYRRNCGRDPRGRKLPTVPEAAAICAVAPGTVYRWKDEFRAQWVPTAGDQRRVYLDSLIRHDAKRRIPRLGQRRRENSSAPECGPNP